MKRHIRVLCLFFLLVIFMQVTHKVVENSADCTDEELGICYEGNECRLEDGIVGICDSCNCIPRV